LEYNDNPQGKALIALCFDEDKEDFIIGQEPIIPMKISIDNQEVHASLSLNSVVHSDYRGKGIFSRLVSSLPELALKRNISFVYGIPNKSSYHSFLNQGWTEIAKLPLLVRPLNLSNYFENFLKKLLRPFDTAWRIKDIQYQSIEEYTDDFTEDFNHLTSKLKKRTRVVQNRNHDFLQWRYKNHPTKKYTIYIQKDSSGIVGYIITRTDNYKGKHIGVILDFVIDSEKENQVQHVNLVKFALLNLQKKHVVLSIATISPRTPEYKILRKAGFFRIPEKMKPEPLPFLVHIFDQGKNNIIMIKKYCNWFFSFGDYDTF